MQQLIPVLFPYERHALREALRRDECRERQRAHSDLAWADWHVQNARLSGRLLKLLEWLENDDSSLPAGADSTLPAALQLQD